MCGLLCVSQLMARGREVNCENEHFYLGLVLLVGSQGFPIEEDSKEIQGVTQHQM